MHGFFGLPDVKPMQQELMKEVAERLRANVKALDPETMLKTWLPAGLKGREQLQERVGHFPNAVNTQALAAVIAEQQVVELRIAELEAT